jgi:hypothetical protein
MPSPRPFARPRWLVLPLLAATVVACGGGTATSPTATVLVPPPATSTVATPSPSATASPSEATPQSQGPDTAGLTTAGDIPDNAVFLTYRDAARGFSIQYVEGWQVTPGPDGVVIRDKDSSETVAVVPVPTSVQTFITNTDLPSLQSEAGFTLVKRDTVKAGSATYDHVVVHLPAPADPVTGKRVPSTVDRFYVPGPSGLAVISLSTPNGVDNVDAFRQMIDSFRWS